MSPIPDALHLLPSLRPSPTSRTTYILYFIPGNPGLISYYTTFLSHLLKLLTSNPTPPSIEIHGRSLSGFEVHPTTQRDGPYTVDQQIAHSEADVRRIVRDARRQGEGKDVKVILMGHSLGTYMVLELVRRLRKDEDKEDGVIVAGGVCLFATVMELAKSDSGVKARGVLSLPYFPLMVSIIAKLLFSFLPLGFLAWLIGTLMSFPPDGARVTASFIQSRDGVRQALFMANDEMTAISTDKWGEEVWGAMAAVGGKGESRSRLKFLFAEKDHWLSDKTRDELIRLRGRKKVVEIMGKAEAWKPEMYVDATEGWVHGFCIKQSVSVAEKVKGWVEEIIADNVGR